jgi:hypothetical protein
MARGIDRKNIFKDDTDRDNFLERLGAIIEETRTHCFAWALIPNHFHYLLSLEIITFLTAHFAGTRFRSQSAFSAVSLGITGRRKTQCVDYLAVC